MKPSTASLSLDATNPHAGVCPALGSRVAFNAENRKEGDKLLGLDPALKLLSLPGIISPHPNHANEPRLLQNNRWLEALAWW